MKRIVCVFVVCLLLTVTCTAALAQGETETQSTAPIVLLHEEYNPFYSTAFPDSYTLTRLECALKGDYGLYKLWFSTQDSAEAIITFAAGLAGFNSAEDIGNKLNELSEQGSIGISGIFNGAPCAYRDKRGRKAVVSMGSLLDFKLGFGQYHPIQHCLSGIWNILFFRSFRSTFAVSTGERINHHSHRPV